MNTGTEDQKSSEKEEKEQEEAAEDLGALLKDEFSAVEPKRGDLCKGIVIEANEAGLLVDFGFKREGFVPAEDYAHLDEEARALLFAGAEVPVFVVRPRTRDGQPALSIQQAQQYEHWLKAEEMLASNGLYEGEVAGCNRGGLIVKYGDIRGFVPTSQVVGMPRRLPEEERRRRLETMVGKQIGLRVIEVDRGRRRLIFSQRRAYREWQERRRQQTMAELTEGEIRHGSVTDLTSFGAFVDLGGADGLIHVSELSWRRVNHPREVLGVGQEVDVYVLSVDRERKRIALSLKKLQPDPWSIVNEHYHVGQLVEGQVTRVLDFGAFIALDLGIEGLLHVSEMIGTPDLQPTDIVKSGDTVLVKVIRIDSDRRRIGLSAKQVRQNEWERWMADQQAAREAEEAAAAEAVAAEAAAAQEAAPPEGPAVEIPSAEETPEEVAAEGAVAEAAAEDVEIEVPSAAEGEVEAEEPSPPAPAETPETAAVATEESPPSAVDVEAPAEEPTPPAPAETPETAAAATEESPPSAVDVEAPAEQPQPDTHGSDETAAPAPGKDEEASSPAPEEDAIVTEEPSAQAAAIEPGDPPAPVEPGSAD